MKWILAALLACLGGAAAAQTLPLPTYRGVILQPQGSTPGGVVNGQCWTQSTGLFCYIAGSTVGPYVPGTGFVTPTGSPASGNLARWSGATSITNGDLSGDVTTSGTLATTLAAGSASVLNSGTLPAGRLPALTGDVTSSAGSAATTLSTVNANVGSWGDGTHVGAFTVDGKGRITAASSVAITGAAPTGSASGDLSGTYPGPTVAKVNGVAYGSGPSTNTVPVVTGSNTVTYEAVPNAALANSATTVNGQSCVLGSTCTITASAGTVTVGTTTVASGTNGYALYDNAGVLGNLQIATGATASTLAERDASANLTSNIGFINLSSTVSAGTTTALTVASSGEQVLTGSSSQTFTLPDATTMALGPNFIFNNNSSGSLIINNNGGSAVYTVPAGGEIQMELISNGTANGTWDGHPKPPLTVTWGSGTTGLVMNSALNTTPSISAGTPSATVPAFIPQRASSTTGFGGDSTHIYGIVGGTTAWSSTSSGTSIAGLTATGSFTATGLVTNADLANSSVTVNGSTCTLGSSCTPIAGGLVVGSTAIGSGTNGRILYDNSGVLGELAQIAAANMPALTGDVTTSAGSVATTLAAGSASNLNSGTLNAARLPALTGDVTSSAGSAATTLAAGSASNLNSGTLAAARGGAGTINGALKGNGSGVVSQAACADLSNGATGCSTATGTSGATIPLLNGANTWSNSQAGSITTLSISTATFTPDASNNHYKLTLVHASCPCTLANPSPSFVAGTSGIIEVVQSSTGSDTIGTWGSSYLAPGGTSSIVLSTGANAIDVLSYFVIDSTHIVLVPSYNFSH